MGDFNPNTFFPMLIVLFLGVGLHEYSHAKFADMAGDPTPRYFGRVTLNLTKHFELMGTIMMVFSALTGFGIGWGKPCPMNPSKMNNPRWDHFVAVLAGPVSNLLQAVVYGLAIRVVASMGVHSLSPFVGSFLVYGVVINLSLCIFNLIPLGPLDGHWLIGSFLDPQTRQRWYMFNRSAGTIILFGLIFLAPSVLGKVLGPPVYAGFKLVTGIDFP